MKNSTPHTYDFQSLKAKVGVTDVAAALGYSIDRKAGVGRYVEMIKIQDGHKADTIVIRNPNDKASQTYFRRDGSKGDAISLIREHLTEFNVAAAGSEWKRIGQVMSRLANEPAMPAAEASLLSNTRQANEFNVLRYKVDAFDPNKRIPSILAERGLNEKTFCTFIDKMCRVVDLHNDNFSGYNVGFPYTANGLDVTGYEMRGRGGFKSKAHGTNSSDAAWVADFSNGMPRAVTDVYFFESAFDAMAFYQQNAVTLDPILDKSVFVSVGGQLSNQQVKNVIDRYPNARIVDCFDNDLSGRVYAVRTALLTSGINAQVAKCAEGLSVTTPDKSFILKDGALRLDAIAKEVSLSSRTASFTAPEGFKDWNDVVLGRRLDNAAVVNKYQRDQALAERRCSSGIKL